ncbi:MAG: hypothetical protein JXR60_00250 [Bacteroidales bacterium]|nr:hypothetical protein [Bacteroidales bacterium]
MLEIYQEEIQRLRQNVRAIMQELKLAKKEISELQNKNKDLEIVVKEKELLIEDLEIKYKHLLNAKALTGKEGIDETKSNINDLVREIDKCIALLNN